MDAKTLNQILEIAFQKKVSDVHFEVDNPPFFRGRGQIVRSKLPNLTAADTEFIATQILEHNRRKLTNDLKELDASYALPSGGRFRVSLFRQRGSLGIVMRVIPPHIGNFDELHLPAVLGEIAQAPNGLILVTGPTGNGKSTTLASMIRFINENASYNIITIEDPIEFLFASQKSCIIQREVGIDTAGFAPALKAALRMDPDVIMVGEMRDSETIDSCIKAAETGHLVLSTLHTQGAISTINRVIGNFPPEAQEIMRQRLADILVATVSLRLIKDRSGEQILPVVEIMRSTTTIQACIREGRLDELTKHIENGRNEYGMQTLDQHLVQLYQADLITIEDAKRLTHSMDLERKLMFTN
ncbi:MAG: twitching motility protein PilT [Desulfuromonadales bacterium GWD2_61_12]|nr:MAG: twitching motility protein PilT [Desulfuromonadales bacterium GWC2_61_20]OGR35202.1 MAG: twitching motility protein PilT [Desulfuromonadales bacterium GWD2_61_12]HAD03896.1 twitching motility protein PilT [Desulfuromonas sp.]HBT83539.1 twitching motility protein PilT [Desulfuromonas sp.]